MIKKALIHKIRVFFDKLDSEKYLTLDELWEIKNMAKKKEIISKSKSFEGFDLVKLIKGQKKTIITAIGGVLGYFITNNESVAVLSGILATTLISVVEFYWKEITK